MNTIRTNKRWWLFALLVLTLILLSAAAWWGRGTLVNKASKFNPDRAMRDVERQISMGPRIPGSPAHAEAVDWMVDELNTAGWETSVQESELMGHPIRNVVAKRGKGSPWIILGAHYDSRIFADQDEDAAKRKEPVPGANDGASGVAVLLELARILPQNLNKQVWLVFFDAEDNGNIAGWDWILGSRAFVESLHGKPDAAVIIDMIGDEDLNIYIERNSNANLSIQIWRQAAELGYSEQFIPIPKHTILDDHLPFIQAGIPAVDVIDIEYPYWHTTQDTPDKVSPESLQIVGETLHAWLTE